MTAAQCRWVKAVDWNAPAAPPSAAYPARRNRFLQLVEELGACCSCCGVSGGRFVDHDHFSGMVRGLLCRVCNEKVDQCLHVGAETCQYAAYLNDPPAKGLGLTYPIKHRRRASDEERASVLGFDLMDSEAWPSGPAAWQWTVPLELSSSAAIVALRRKLQLAEPGAGRDAGRKAKM